MGDRYGAHGDLLASSGCALWGALVVFRVEGHSGPQP